MNTSTPTELWAFTGAVNRLGLEQFASSVAALASGTRSPIAVLEQVLGAIVEHMNSQNPGIECTIEQLLEERARAYGFESVREFRLSLLQMIGERIVDLECSKLSFAQPRN